VSNLEVRKWQCQTDGPDRSGMLVDVAATMSAGLLVYRRDEDAVRVLLAHMGGPYWARKDDRAWTIPKGEYGDGEDALTAARREFAEELGTPPPASGRYEELGEIRQSGGKIVTAWAVEGDFDVTTHRSNTFELEWPPHSGRSQTFPEVDRAGWFDLDIATTKLVAGQAPFLARLTALTEGR
jgi:predicted NUDIX family NTP pyrophosphohydrolase